MQDKQNITAAEQAAWHAGLDEGRAQAAPAAVAVPDERAAFENFMRIDTSGFTLERFEDGNYKEFEVATYWHFWQARAALAATPAAAPDMVSVKKEDANNYCRILAALGMEEEGDPVAEVKLLREMDKDFAQTIEERDTAEGWADGLAGLIGKHFGKDIGEHSSAHCPWQAAKEIIEDAEPPAAAAPVVLPEPFALYDGEKWYANEEAAICSCANMQKLQKVYIEQQVRALLATATGLPAQAVEQAPVLYVSKEQLDSHTDHADSEAGRYLPCRITPAGKFITPLFAVPQAQADARDADEGADMFWDADDRERCENDIDDIISGYSDGAILKIERAKRLPSITVRVIQNADGVDYERIDRAAIAAAKGE